MLLLEDAQRQMIAKFYLLFEYNITRLLIIDFFSFTFMSMKLIFLLDNLISAAVLTA